MRLKWNLMKYSALIVHKCTFCAKLCLGYTILQLHIVDASFLVSFYTLYTESDP
jgi:hypothetical protein